MIDAEKYEQYIDRMAQVYISAMSTEDVDDAISDLAEELLGEVGVDGTVHTEAQGVAYGEFINYASGQAYLRAGIVLTQVGEAEIREIVRAGTEGLVVEYTKWKEEQDESSVR